MDNLPVGNSSRRSNVVTIWGNQANASSRSARQGTTVATLRSDKITDEYFKKIEDTLIRRLNDMELNTWKVDHIHVLSSAFEDMTHGKKSLSSYSEQLCRLLSTLKIYSMKVITLKDDWIKNLVDENERLEDEVWAMTSALSRAEADC